MWRKEDVRLGHISWWPLSLAPKSAPQFRLAHRPHERKHQQPASTNKGQPDYGDGRASLIEYYGRQAYRYFFDNHRSISAATRKRPASIRASLRCDPSGILRCFCNDLCRAVIPSATNRGLLICLVHDHTPIHTGG